MHDSYCPEHRGLARIIIDTWPGRCGDCCNASNKAGFKHGDGQHKCPELWREVSPEEFVAMHQRQPFKDNEHVLFDGRYFVDERVFAERRQS